MSAIAYTMAMNGFCASESRVQAARVDSDWGDVQATLSGDDDAFARLVARYQAQVFSQMWRFTRQRETLDELVQEVFVETYRSLPHFKGHAPFLHWVRRIATRVGYRHWKRQARDRRLREAIAQHAAAPSLAPEAQTPPEAAEHLYALLEQLAPKDRLILTLAYFDDCNAQEIAARMGWSANLVRVRAHRARQKLRQRLEEAGFGRSGHG